MAFIKSLFEQKMLKVCLLIGYLGWTPDERGLEFVNRSFRNYNLAQLLQ